MGDIVAVNFRDNGIVWRWEWELPKVAVLAIRDS